MYERIMSDKRARKKKREDICSNTHGTRDKSETEKKTEKTTSGHNSFIELK
jgi:hypothetical protein